LSVDVSACLKKRRDQQGIASHGSNLKRCVASRPLGVHVERIQPDEVRSVAEFCDELGYKHRGAKLIHVAVA
jgi:hypothetical protein